MGGKKDMKWIAGAVCIVAVVIVLGMFIAGVAITTAGKCQTD